MKFLFLILTSFFLTPYAQANTKILGGSSLADKTMNPAISINGLFLGSYGTLPEKKGIRLQEIEAQFSAAVDPYFMGNFTVSLESNGTVEIEEAYFSTLSLPVVTLMGGKFYAKFGKNNPFHTHLQPFIDKPLVNRTLLGTEGFKTVGLEASVQIPTPWSFELTVAALGTGTDIATTTPFQSTNPQNLSALARMDHSFNLSDVTTLGIGASYSIGEGKVTSKNVSLLGADLTLKYLSGKGKGDFAVSWVNEYIQGSRTEYATLATPEWEKAKGFYSTALVRVSQFFWVGARTDYIKIDDTGVSTTGDHVLVAYVPSEFSTIRLQGGISRTTNEDSKWQALLQYNLMIGSHTAHAY